MTPGKSSSDATRRISPTELKAFAHPLRMEMYRLLGEHGPATASTLARETGESTGQTSYHLRQLARFGFVEEVAGQGTARERWWRATSFSFSDTSDPQTFRTVTRWMIDDHTATLQEAAAQFQSEPQEWQDATTRTATTTWMTAEELDALGQALSRVLKEHVEAADRRREEAVDGPDAPGRHRAVREGERRVRVYVDTLPLPGG